MPWKKILQPLRSGSSPEESLNTFQSLRLRGEQSGLWKHGRPVGRNEIYEAGMAKKRERKEYMREWRRSHPRKPLTEEQKRKNREYNRRYSRCHVLSKDQKEEKNKRARERMSELRSDPEWRRKELDKRIAAYPEWYSKNKDRLHAERKRRRLKHRDMINEANRLDRKLNVKKYRERDRQYYIKHRDALLRQRKERRLKNIEQARERRRVYLSTYRALAKDRMNAYARKYYSVHRIKIQAKRNGLTIKDYLRQRKLKINPWQIMSASKIIGTYASTNQPN
jgi:hypothetical protein